MATELPDQNPFASPLTDERPVVPGTVELSEAEQIRQEFIKHETSVRSIGILYYISVFILALYVIGAGFVILSGEETGLLPIGIAAVCGFLAAAQWWVARGLRTLNGAVRPWAILLAVLGLLNIPIGTLISIYIIYLLACAKGKYVMTPEYQEIRAATPHIKYKTPWYVWALLSLVFLLVAAVVIGAIIFG